MQAETKFQLNFDKTRQQKIKNKRQSLKPTLKQSEAQTQEFTQSGMTFPDTVLSVITCDKKSIYSQVVTKNVEVKLTSQGFGGTAITSVQKVKLYSNKVPEKITLKLQTQKEQYIYHLRKQDFISVFTKLLWLRLATMNIFTDLQASFDQCISSKGLKKSDILGKWQEVYFRLSKKEGLQISSSQKFESYTRVKKSSQFWTRFQVIDNNSYLVVKLWHGMLKYELGVPICREVTWWMQGFCCMLIRQ